MANEPQRDIEQDLLAYQQRRREQLGAPLELHPATRKMLQGEAARAASRPLLTSEEAAKNFVRSFVMSHQQPGFFARHRPRLLWGGGMCACLAIVLIVLRNDPQQAARRREFTDPLPPAPLADTQATPPAAAIAGNQPLPVGEQLVREKKAAQVADVVQEVAKSASASGGSRGAGTRRMALDADNKLVEQAEIGEKAQLAKALKAAPDRFGTAPPAAQQAGEAAVKLKLAEELKRTPATAASTPAPVAAPMPAPANVSLTRQLSPAAGGAGAAQVSWRFQQLDSRAGYRQNLNSPPVPQIMQDFAFERAGDRVRIVDADGSTYEGAVLPAPEAAARPKLAREQDELRVSREAAGQPSQSGGTARAEAPTAYRFYASGLNRKLNQSVEFRGQWLPVAPAPAAPTTPALQTTSLGAVRLEAQSAEKKEQPALTNARTDNRAPARGYFHLQSQPELSVGRISGRAVVGGRNEFDINAVPK